MNSNSEEILLGIDYGDSNTGLAFGRSGLAAPLEAFTSKDPENLIAHIGKLVITNKVTKLIVGLPLDWEGKETVQSLKVRKFVKLLKIRVKRPVEFVSEHGTTKEAIEGAIRSGYSMRGRRENDALSAAVIVKRYYSKDLE